MGYHFQISAKLLSWPRACPCCGGVADAQFRASASRTTGKRVQNTRTCWWDVPYCLACLSHKRTHDYAALWLASGLVAGLATWFMAGRAMGDSGAGFFAGVLVAAVAIWPYSETVQSAKRKMKPSCCTPGAAVSYVGWYGSVHTFEFASQEYMEGFLSANSRKARSDVTRV